MFHAYNCRYQQAIFRETLARASATGPQFNRCAHGPRPCSICDACSGCDKYPLFHVRFLKDGVEQTHVFVGTPNGRGGWELCEFIEAVTLTFVAPHNLTSYCEVCDNANGITPHDREVFDRFLTRVENGDREAFIRAEVEAMDWPEEMDC